MALQIGSALGDGVRRAFSYSGGVLMALLFAYMVVFVGAVNSLVAGFLPAEAQESAQIGLTFPIPAVASGALLVVGLLFGIVLYIVATRALTREQAELSTLPSGLFTRRIGRATLSAVGANIVVQLAVMIGFILLIVPGIFIAVSFVFVVFAIGIEDRRAIASLSRSWELASGNRWRLFALLLIIAVVSGVGGAFGSVFSFIGPTVGQIASLFVTAIFSVVSYGILADAYIQLTEEDDIGGSGGAESPNPSGAAV